MLDALGRFLGGLRPAERVAIIFDEAQGLSDEALEDLRLLSNYGRPGENQLQLILAGQPELLRRLMAPTLRQFNERIGARTLLVPLDASETLEYIDYRLRAKGGPRSEDFQTQGAELHRRGERRNSTPDKRAVPQRDAAGICGGRQTGHPQNGKGRGGRVSGSVHRGD